MKIIDLKNALVGAASCYSIMHFLEEGRKLKISLIAGVLSASVIALKNENAENEAAALETVKAGVASASAAGGSTTFALVTGYYSGAMTFYNSNTLKIDVTLKPPVGDRDVFIAKINGDGTWLWAVDAGSSSGEEGSSITAMYDNTALITGYYTGGMTFYNSNTLKSGVTLKPPVGNRDVFIAKINGDGIWLWAVGAGSSSLDRGYSITAMCDNTALVTGVYRDAMTFFNSNKTQSGIMLKKPVPFAGGGGSSDDVFIAKINGDGSWLWAINAGSSDLDRGYSITAMCDNTALVTGVYGGAMTFYNSNTSQSSITLKTPVPLTFAPYEGSFDVFIAKINANGTWIWAVDAGSSDSDSGLSITAMGDNTALVTGDYRGAMTFYNSNATGISITLKPPAGDIDAFIAKINADGNWIWAVNAGSASLDVGRSITAMGDNTALVTGSYRGAMTFYNSNTNKSITLKRPVGSTDAFIAKIDSNGTWIWAVDAGSSSEGFGITSMYDNTALVTGFYSQAMTFYNSNTTQSGITLKRSDGSTDVFIAKINANGTWLWAVDAGSSAPDLGFSIIRLKPKCEALVTGSYNDAMTFYNSNRLKSDVTLKPPVGDRDVFIAKINGDGSWLWAINAGSSSLDLGYSITSMCDNTALVTGFYSGAMTFYSFNTSKSDVFLKPPVGDRDVFIAKINADGTWLWVVNAGSSSGEEGVSITAMYDNTALVTGYYSGEMSFFNSNKRQSGITLKPPVQLSGGGTDRDVFIAKINADGTWLWAVNAGSSNTDSGLSITAMCDNTALVTGYYSDAMTFYNSKTNMSLTYKPFKPFVGERDIFIAKINAAGTWLWAAYAGSSANDVGLSITSMCDNTALVTGYYSGAMTFYNSTKRQSNITLKTPVDSSIDAFIAKINADGIWLWAVNAGSSSLEVGRSIVTMGDNTALVTGYYRGAMTFYNSNASQSSITLKRPVGSTDAFIAKIDSNGTWIWAVNAGSSSEDVGRSITAMGDNTALVTGSFSSEMTFYNSNKTQSGITLKTPVGGTDVFIAKINADGTWLWAVDAGSLTGDEGWSITALR